MNSLGYLLILPDDCNLRSASSLAGYLQLSIDGLRAFTHVPQAEVIGRHLGDIEPTSIIMDGKVDDLPVLAGATGDQDRRWALYLWAAKGRLQATGSKSVADGNRL